MRQNLIDIIKICEEKLPVHQWKINEVTIWPLIKLELYYNRSEIIDIKKQKKRKKSNLLYLSSKLKFLLYLFKKKKKKTL